MTLRKISPFSPKCKIYLFLNFVWLILADYFSYYLRTFINLSVMASRFSVVLRKVLYHCMIILNNSPIFLSLVF